MEKWSLPLLPFYKTLKMNNNTKQADSLKVNEAVYITFESEVDYNDFWIEIQKIAQKKFNIKKHSQTPLIYYVWRRK